MAGALTANAVDVRLATAEAADEVAFIADVTNLSPVDGANNVLLTGVVIVEAVDEAADVVLQWYRIAPGNTILDDVAGDAVGDPFTVVILDSELIEGPIVVQAIDRGPGLTSAYGLGVTGAEIALVEPTAIYADAVLYD